MAFSKTLLRRSEWVVAGLVTVATGLTIPFPAANVFWLGAKRGSVGDKQLVR
jgi:hypothetical protein